MTSNDNKNTGVYRKTKREIATELMRQRLFWHIEDWYAGYSRPEPQAFDFLTEDKDFELWECRLKPSPNTENREMTVWLFWNNQELQSYDTYQKAFVAFVSEQKIRRIQGRLKYFASPLVVSAFLALAMMGVISIMLVKKMPVPDQLWSVFTAVVAFYFGREGRVRAATPAGAE